MKCVEPIYRWRGGNKKVPTPCPHPVKIEFRGKPYCHFHNPIGFFRGNRRTKKMIHLTLTRAEAACLDRTISLVNLGLSGNDALSAQKKLREELKKLANTACPECDHTWWWHDKRCGACVAYMGDKYCGCKRRGPRGRTL